MHRPFSNRIATRSLAFAVAFALTAFPLHAEDTGVVTGRVTDAQMGGALPGAQVRIAALGREAVTDRGGEYRLSGLPAGEQSIEISYLGFEAATVAVRIDEGTAVRRDAQLRLAGFREDVTVSAPILEGQARALNQQQNALNIVSVVSADQIGAFPDPNAAEAVQRVPGVSIQRDQGEGRYVLVRGTEARLNSMMIDGERIPSPEGDIRSVALDVIPADLLQAIEVTKALTPDMDGDAIGGAVNLITRQAPEKRRVYLDLGGGYNSISEDTLQTGKASYGRRFDEDRLGLIFSGSFLNTDRGSENFEAAYDDGELEELDLRDYTINRRRWGGTGALDYRLTDGGSLFLRGIYNSFRDQEYRRRLINKVADGELERELKDRLETQEIVSIAGGGKHFLSNRWQVDYSLSWAHAEEDEPGAQYSSFLLEDVEFAPNVTPTSIDPANVQAYPQNENLDGYRLDSWSREDNLTTDRDIVGALNLTTPFGSEGTNGTFKVGVKLRDKNKERDNGTVEFDVDDDLLLSDVRDGFTSPDGFLDGLYEYTLAHPGADTIRSLTSGLEGESDPEADLADYRASERVLAGYAMAEVHLGRRLMLLPGVRYEYTDIEYTGYEVAFDDEGDFAGTRPLTGDNSYGLLLPMAHLRYRIDDRSNLRAAITRSLARPNYFDLTPYELVLEEDLEIERGNPQLDPTRAWNFDLMYERYFSSVGLVSAGVFHKRLDDYIYAFTGREERPEGVFQVRQPLNGESATITGFEVALQNRLSFLPAPFDGLGIYANYTLSDSEAVFPDREGENATLPGQSRHVGNLALSYENNRFSGRVALNFHGKYVDAVGESAEQDVYYDDHSQLDVAASLRIAGDWRIYLDLVNLTNEPLRYYEGHPDRPIQEEYYRWWGTFGVKLSF